MTSPTPYLHFDGVAAEALRFYQKVFGGELSLHTFAEFGRDDGPGDALAHGILSGPVDLLGADVTHDERPVHVEGLMLSLLGSAAPDVLEGWFSELSDGGDVVDALQRRPWGDVDGVVRDRFGVTWLVGHEGGAADA